MPHDGLHVNSGALPREHNQMESPKVKEQHESQHASPTACQWGSLDNVCSHPDQGYSHESLCCRCKPLPRRNPLLFASISKEPSRIHGGRQQQVRRTPFPVPRARTTRTRLPPRQPLTSRENASRQQPHESPSSHICAQREGEARQNDQRYPRNPMSIVDTSPYGTPSRRRLSNCCTRLHDLTSCRAES